MAKRIVPLVACKGKVEMIPRPCSMIPLTLDKIIVAMIGTAISFMICALETKFVLEWFIVM